MKKRIALTLAVMLLAGIGCAWAEATAEEPQEITFRDFQWGISVEDVVSQLSQIGVNMEYFDFDVHLHGTHVEYFDDHFESGILDDNENAVLNWTDSLKEGSFLLVREYPERIGGYEVEMMCFDFLLEVENQSWNRDATHLRQVSIALVNCDMDDMLQKLTGIYGEPAQMRNGYMWYGDHATAVYLEDGFYCLYYGEVDAMETIEAQVAEINGKPKPTANPADISGL